MQTYKELIKIIIVAWKTFRLQLITIIYL
jgi:hypothetical protein